jgi:hypothetical protein
MAYTPEQMQTIARLANDGKTVEAIMREVHLSPGTIKYILQQFGILPKKRIVKEWTAEDREFVKQNCSAMTVRQMAVALNRTEKAIKHIVNQEDLWGVKLQEKRAWMEEDLAYVRDNPQESNEEIAKKINRTMVAVQQKRKELFGTSRVTFKTGWNVPGADLAWFLGILASDGFVDDYTFVFYQAKHRQGELSDKVKEILKDRFGLDSKYIYLDTKSESGVITTHSRLVCCSRMFMEEFGDDAARARNNLKDNGDWSKFVLDKFPWVLSPEYRWHFLGGLYDGDGSLARKKDGVVVASFASKPPACRKIIRTLLEEEGIRCAEYTCGGGEETINSVTIVGGREATEIFLKKIQCMLSSKKNI